MTLPNRPHGYDELVATFGDPLEYLNDKPAWERAALVTLRLPRPLIYAYDETRFVTKVTAHRLIAQNLVDTLMLCLDAGVTLDRLKYGGCYQWRAQRGAAKLSAHTWGIAIDLEPAENPLGKPWRDDGKMLDLRIVELFETRGWFWGNRFRRMADAQHFQYLTGY